MKKNLLPIILALIVCSCSREYSSYSTSDFLTDRNNVLSYLSDSFAQAPQGAELSRISANQKGLAPSFPGDKHIISVMKRQRWMSHGGHLISLNLSDALLSSTDKGGSGTNAATRILDHYFSGLSRFGFRNQGSASSFSSGNMLYAGNVWFREETNNISIFGHVYVDRNEKSALVVMNLSELY